MEQLLSLPLLIFLPIIAILILSVPFFNGKIVLIRRFAKGFAGFHFLYSIFFILFFENFQENGLAFYKNIQMFGKNWIDILGIKFAFGIDNLSLLLSILTIFIFFIVFIVSKNHINTNAKLYYSLLFLLECSFLGVFCAQDIFLFYTFWLLILIPIYFLLSLWGIGNCKRTAMKYIIFNFLGALFILIGILLLHFYNFACFEHLTADFSEFSISAPKFPIFMQMLISILLLLGLIIRIPLFPFHTYFIEANTDAVCPVSVIISSICPLTGIYGYIKFNILILPQTFSLIVPVLCVLAFISVIHCSLTSFAQDDFKKALSYLVVSSFAFGMFGLFSYSEIGLSGVIYHLISNSLIISALFVVAGVIFLRTKTYDFAELGGLAHVMPRLSGFNLIISCAFIGIPFLSNFISIYLVLYGFLKYSLFDNESLLLTFIAIVLPVSLLIISFNILKYIHKIFFGNIYERWNLGMGLPDITYHEFLVLLVCVIAIIILGIFPMDIINFVQPYVENIINALQV